MTIALTGSAREDARTLCYAARDAALRALLATELEPLTTLAAALAEYEGYPDFGALILAGTIAGKYGKPRAARATAACWAAANVITASEDLDDLERRDYALTELGKAQRNAAQVESLRQWAPPAGVRGSRKGHG